MHADKKVADGSERHYTGGQENNIFGSEGSQAVPASPSDMIRTN
jgi:hypothetical protein